MRWLIVVVIAAALSGGLILPHRALARDLNVKVVSMTSPVKAGGMATLTVRTAPKAQCMPTVRSKSGEDVAASLGLKSKSADTRGMVSWSLRVPPETPAGTWPVEVTCSMSGKQAKTQTSVTVQ